MLDLNAAWDAAMRRRDYAAAWEIDGLVLNARDPVGRDDPGLPYHRRWVWDGRPFQGRHVLVRCYHGLGDTLQYARYLPVLAAYAASLTVELQPALVRIVASIPGIDRLVPFDPAHPLPPSDCDIEIMELAFALRVTPETLRPPYLYSPATASPAGTVGLCWQAGDWDAARAIPEALMASLAAGPSLSLMPRPTALDVLNPDGCPPDVARTAALVAGLDLVITVDTMIAHLAGTLDRPTWLLLKHDADWRWGDRQRDSPWYPSMRLYRQPRPGDWGAVVADAVRDLKRFRQTQHIPKESTK